MAAEKLTITEKNDPTFIIMFPQSSVIIYNSGSNLFVIYTQLTSYLRRHFSGRSLLP